MSWELVWVGPGEAAARVVAGGLRGQGVRTRLSGYDAGPLAGISRIDNWAIYVPARQSPRARRWLAETEPGGIVSSSDDVVASNARMLMTPLKISLVAALLLAIFYAFTR